MRDESTRIYQILVREVGNVYGNHFTDDEVIVTLTDEDLHHITERICEDRAEDAQLFTAYLSDVEHMDDDDDWSEVNNGIKNIIKDYMQKNKLKAND